MSAAMDRERFVAWLREELPRLLREDPDFGARVLGVLTQTLASKADLAQILEEIRRLREDFNRRFEAAERRFEAMERRFEAAERRFESIERTLAAHSEALLRHEKVLRDLRIGLGSLGHRTGRALEDAVRQTVEEFTGGGPLRAEQLVLRDERGEVFGVPGQGIEFDAFVYNGRRVLVEVKAFAEPEDVLKFHHKLEFAARVLQEPFERVLIAPFALPRAVERARQLGIRVFPEERPDGAAEAEG